MKSRALAGSFAPAIVLVCGFTVGESFAQSAAALSAPVRVPGVVGILGAAGAGLGGSLNAAAMSSRQLSFSGLTTLGQLPSLAPSHLPGTALVPAAAKTAAPALITPAAAVGLSMPQAAVSPIRREAEQARTGLSGNLADMSKGAETVLKGLENRSAESSRADAAAMFGEKTEAVDAALAQPSAILPAHEFVTGERVITADFQQGEIVGFYPDGDVVIRTTSLGGHVKLVRAPASKLARTSGRYLGLSISEWVFLPDFDHGHILGFYADGDVVIATNRGGHVRLVRAPASGLGRTSGDAFGFSIKESVVLPSLRQGEVVAFYANGDVVVRTLGTIVGFHHAHASELGRASGRHLGFSIEESVILPDLSHGKVIGFYANGDIAIRTYRNGFVAFLRVPSAELARTSGNHPVFSIGKSVILPDLSYGTVIGFYANGDIAVRTFRNGFVAFRRVPSSELART